VRSLVLFDIDATLLKTDGAGVAAMETAGKELFGERFTTAGVDFAGSLDSLLFRQMLRACGVEPTPGIERELRTVYGRHLAKRLSGPTTARALAGAIELVTAVRAAEHHITGLLTGNFAETGAMKLRACGLDPDWFTICAWGDDSPHDPPDREHLPPVAMRRFHERFGTPIPAARVTIIGDTIHDVRCARASGCRSIGVATGKYSMEELRAAGADHVVPDLAETSDILAWIDPARNPRQGLS
jgi:phosphoglycolate phosphatase-like HAD superfamily hydrolase